MERDPLPEYVLSALSGLRDGDLDSTADTVNILLEWCGLELHSRAIVGSAKVSWEVDIRHDRSLQKVFLSMLDTKLRRVNAIQTSLNDCLESGRRTLLYSFGHSCVQSIYSWSPPEASRVDKNWKQSRSFMNEIYYLVGFFRLFQGSSIPSYAVDVSAVALRSLVYRYLTGNVDRGGFKAYSRSSLDFRDIYVPIVLFLGAYVWIKFREVAFKGVHPRKLVDKQGGIKVVYAARLTPPMWNGKKVPRLELGRFATPQEAHNKFVIAAFYYNRSSSEECLLDGWFQVPPMSEEARSLTGLELRAWVIGQAKKVYEDFQKEAALCLQGFLEACEDQVTPEQREVNVDPCGASLLNSAEHQQPALVSEAENLAMLDNHGLECASHSFDGMHEGFALSNGHGLGFGEGSALPVSQMPPNTESGMSLTGSDQLNLLQTRLGTSQQQISNQQQLIQEFGAQILQLRGSEQFFLLQTRLDPFQQQISVHQQQMEEFRAQILQLQHQRYIPQQQQLQDSRIQNPRWSYQFCLQEQQLEDVNQGVPGFEMEMEQSMY